MKANTKWTALAIALATATAGAAQAQDVEYNETVVIDHDITVDDTRNYTTNTNTTTNTSTNTNTHTTTTNLDANASLDLDVDVDLAYSDSFDRRTRQRIDQSLTESHSMTTNQEYENIERTENVSSERNEHGVNVQLDKELSLSSDIAFTGDPTLSGDIEIDSAAIAVVDNRQSITGNLGLNDMLTNDASIGDDVGSDASGNLAFNVAAGDNNAQDNAAALSAADASFAFGLADAEIFVNQYGAGNETMNMGVTNAADVGGNAFANASGNIGVNVASGNNNEQKNAMAASVATAAYAQSSVSSNQVSTGNAVSNAGRIEQMTDSVDVTLTGSVQGLSLGVGVGAYEGTQQGNYAGRGNAYQQSNFYADMWEGQDHPAGANIGHADFDGASQGAVLNPYRGSDDHGPIGGLAFDTDEAGSYRGSEEGELGFVELSYSDLVASLSGTVSSTQWIVVDATNTASLSGSAFSGASGNIGVNVAAGTGNLQANSLAMAVAQPSTGGGGGGGGGEQ
ncbi:adhesin [Luteimonas sp. SJ-92]|uniref:Adhesin n=1 Tax=Luteimonas salinisoli TaxID=2752307 RepID=A0A853J7F5_9GAMM|nr:adhesin [Luteimonas salinisoli]NZA25011.1 adhesin [Luteimonas salinisoli]